MSRPQLQTDGRPQQQHIGDSTEPAGAAAKGAKSGGGATGGRGAAGYTQEIARDGAAGREQQLLSLYSDDEEDRDKGDSGDPIPEETTSTSARKTLNATEGVETVDKTPLLVQWLFPLKAAAASRQQRNAEISLAAAKTDTDIETNTPAATRHKRGTLCVGSPLLRVQCASLVAVLDAARFGPPRSAQAAAAAASAATDVFDLIGDPSGVCAAGREVLPRTQQFCVPLMLRDLQKVSAAMHLPAEDVAAEAAAAAAAASGDASDGTAAAGLVESGAVVTALKGSYLRPFTTGIYRSAAAIDRVLLLLLLLLCFPAAFSSPATAPCHSAPLFFLHSMMFLLLATARGACRQLGMRLLWGRPPVEVFAAVVSLQHLR